MMNSEDRKDALKEMIRKLHDGEDVDRVKEEFREFAKDATPADIAQAEQELIQEGMDVQEIRRLCEVHLAAFRETLEEEKPIAPPGHPIHTLMEEHRILVAFAEELKGNVREMKVSESYEECSDNMRHFDHVVEHLKDSSSHYLREENVLFPYLEKHGITQPPKIMWMDHDKIREIEKDIYGLHEKHKDMDFKDFAEQLDQAACALADMFTSHFQKENSILFPTSMQVMEENEWPEIKKEFNDIGYCCFTPEPEAAPVEAKEEGLPSMQTVGGVVFDTGELNAEQIAGIFSTLPVDITFVDKDDTVRFYSESGGRIFVRTKAVIGRTVQQCHPQKSVHVVNQILDDFRNGKRDKAEFWIGLKDRLIYIRYFPVRNTEGEYMGTLEVTQDITDIQKIEGEKRLLD